MEANIGQNLSFLDLLVGNQHGILSSSVYHKPTTEPCVVAFTSDHPRHVFANVIQATLLRAARYSSTLEIFQKEYRTIRLMLLYNGWVSSIETTAFDLNRSILLRIFFCRYPSKYIDTHYRRFFVQHHPTSSLIPLIYDENQFLLIEN